MLGIIYHILCMLTGMEMGILMLTWAVYILSWMFSICAGAEHPLFYGNLIVFLVDILLLSGIYR